MSVTASIAILERTRAVVHAATVFAECCDESHLDEKERYVLDVLRERLQMLRDLHDPEPDHDL